MLKSIWFFTLIVLVSTSWVGCKKSGSEASSLSLPDITDPYTTLQEMFLDAKPGDTLIIPRGIYSLDRALSLDGVPRVTVRGAGMNETILSFKTQVSGAEGLRITADSILLEDFTVQDTKGDAIKIQGARNIHIRRVQTTWSGGADEKNGGYGLYPVQCSEVLIEHCEARYASDAGIYVGQSSEVIVRNNLAYGNVAGIEIENCINSEVYDNRAENNTGGILVFDLPDLQVVNGHSCKVYRNQVIDNNHDNFAPPGNIVGTVPPGTGIILMAAKKVEIYDNDIIGHKTMGTAVASYLMTQLPWKDTNYDPYTRDIIIRNNRYERKSAIPDLTKDFGKMVNLLFPAKPQDILYDGILPDDARGVNPQRICLLDNEAADQTLRFANVDAAHDFKNVNKNIADYTCAATQ